MQDMKTDLVVHTHENGDVTLTARQGGEEKCAIRIVRRMIPELLQEIEYADAIGRMLEHEATLSA